MKKEKKVKEGEEKCRRREWEGMSWEDGNRGEEERREGKVRGGKWFKEMGRGWQGERKEDHTRRGEEGEVDKEERAEAEGKEEDGSDKGVGEICS